MKEIAREEDGAQKRTVIIGREKDAKIQRGDKEEIKEDGTQKRTVMIGREKDAEIHRGDKEWR